MPYKTMSARSLLASASIDSLLISRAWTSAFVEGPSRRVRFEPFQWLAAPFSIRTGGRNGRGGRRALSYKTMYIRSLSTNAPVDLVLASWAWLWVCRRPVQVESEWRLFNGLRPVSGPAATAKPGRHDKNLILIPRVKLGVGPAISESVSSVFKEMRRHFRFGVIANASDLWPAPPPPSPGSGPRVAWVPLPRADAQGRIGAAASPPPCSDSETGVMEGARRGTAWELRPAQGSRRARRPRLAGRPGRWPGPGAVIDRAPEDARPRALSALSRLTIRRPRSACLTRAARRASGARSGSARGGQWATVGADIKRSNFDFEEQISPNSQI